MGEGLTLRVQFDPAYRADAHSRVAEEALRVTYDEHPHVDEVALRGAVSFPNLHFEKTEVRGDAFAFCVERKSNGIWKNRSLFPFW